MVDSDQGIAAELLLGADAARRTVCALEQREAALVASLQAEREQVRQLSTELKNALDSQEELEDLVAALEERVGSKTPVGMKVMSRRSSAGGFRLRIDQLERQLKDERSRSEEVSP